ncbi:MAG: ABC transporter permease [Clostridia bacterium]|nr:ABC transporter permease [Clostridia bacterium]
MEENKNLLSEELPEEESVDTADVAVETAVATETEDVHGENLSDRVRMLSPGQLVAKRFFRSKLSVIGLITLVLLFLFSFVGPLLPGCSEWVKDGAPEADRNKDNIKEIVYVDVLKYEIINADGETEILYAYNFMTNQDGELNWYADMNSTHWLGTDMNGYDIFTNLMLGGRVSLTIGFVVIFLEAILGVILGGIAGYFGGWVDNLIMRIVDILSCIPTIPIMLILSQMLESWNILDIRKLYFLMAILTLLGWTGIARMVRGQILSLREQEFMLAAKCSGLSTFRKIFKHLLPNVMPQLIVQMTMGLGSIILTEATLGFLGIGVPLGTPTWGSMINSATKMDILIGYPNFWIPPGICITLAILAFNFVGDGLRDAFDPKMKR